MIGLFEERPRSALQRAIDENQADFCPECFFPVDECICTDEMFAIDDLPTLDELKQSDFW